MHTLRCFRALRKIASDIILTKISAGGPGPFQNRPQPGTDEYQRWWETLSPEQQQSELGRLQKEDPDEYEVMKMTQEDQQVAAAKAEKNMRYYYNAKGNGVMRALPEDARALGLTEELTKGDLDVYNKYQTDRAAWDKLDAKGRVGKTAPKLSFTGFRGTGLASMQEKGIAAQNTRKNGAIAQANSNYAARMKELARYSGRPGESPADIQMHRRMMVAQARSERDAAIKRAEETFDTEQRNIGDHYQRALSDPNDTYASDMLRAAGAGLNRDDRTAYGISKSQEAGRGLTAAEDRLLATGAGTKEELAAAQDAKSRREKLSAQYGKELAAGGAERRNAENNFSGKITNAKKRVDAYWKGKDPKPTPTNTLETPNPAQKASTELQGSGLNAQADVEPNPTAQSSPLLNQPAYDKVVTPSTKTPPAKPATPTPAKPATNFRNIYPSILTESLGAMRAGLNEVGKQVKPTIKAVGAGMGLGPGYSVTNEIIKNIGRRFKTN